MTAKQIEALRSRLGVSKLRFARTLGVSPRTLHGWLSGDHRPSALALEQLRRLSVSLRGLARTTG